MLEAAEPAVPGEVPAPLPSRQLRSGKGIQGAAPVGGEGPAAGAVVPAIAGPGELSAKCQHPRAFSRSRASAMTIQLPPAFATLIGDEAKHPTIHQYMA
jgi:hypothetical protein